MDDVSRKSLLLPFVLSYDDVVFPLPGSTGHSVSFEKAPCFLLHDATSRIGLLLFLDTENKAPWAKNGGANYIKTEQPKTE